MDDPGSPAQARCYIHAGTHKTGTTAIQRFLAANDAVLAASGTHYPRTARLSESYPGHHNLAFELLDAPPFDPAGGTLAEAMAEIHETGAPRACLSAEDFECLHARPERMPALRDAVEAIGYRPIVVLSLRHQADYTESLFAELVKHGSTMPFERFTDTVLEEGVLSMSTTLSWVFRFEYARLVEPFAAVFGRDNVVVRPYVDDGGPQAVVRDFVELLDPTPRPAEFYASAARENPRMTVADVIRLLFANTVLEAGYAELAELGELYAADEAAQHPFVALTPRRRRQIAERFAADNAAVLGAAAAVLGSAKSSLGDTAAERARRLFAEAEAVRTALIDTGGAQRSARSAG